MFYWTALWSKKNMMPLKSLFQVAKKLRNIDARHVSGPME